ncbi:MAG: VOC family protein [Acholeplasmataceae bacterium]|nr:VOC family protein [Acholeplasmataceae bacterium]
MKPLKGIHHVTVITSSAEKIYDFFTSVLGLRLVKKTINQDDIQTYHLFFADDIGSPGTDMTFFDFPGTLKASKGTNEIAKTGFRVPDDQAIDYFMMRFDHYDVTHAKPSRLFDRKILFFEDFDGQEYFLISDQNVPGVPSGTPWKHGPVPDEYAITGLGPIWFRVDNHDLIEDVLTHKLTFGIKDQDDNLILFETGEGGNGAAIITEVTKGLRRGSQGYGSIHHVAFRVDDTEDINAWIKRLNQGRHRHSGLIDRFYFKSLYTRLYPGLLFEFATDGPGFIDDEEDYETLGETLALPPRFRSHRVEIERLIRPIDTTRSDKPIKKEYFG